MKRRYITYIVTAVLSLLCIFACKRVDIEENVTQTGWLFVSLDRDDSEKLIVKSANVADYTFSLKVYNELNQEVASVSDYTTLADSPLKLNVGKYTVVASSAADAQAAAFDAPFYTGSTGIEILPDQVCNADITCTLANVKVTANFSSDFVSDFKSYKLEVSNTLGTLTFSSTDGTISKEGYFKVTGTLTWKLTLVNTDDEVYSTTDTYTEVKAQEHYSLNFSLEPLEEIGANALKVVVNGSMVDKEYNMALDFGDTTVPELSDSFGYVEGQASEFNAGDTSVKAVSLTTEDGLRNLYLTYEPSVSAFSTGSSQTTVDLVEASSDLISALAAEGIKVSSVPLAAKSASVDLTDYLSFKPIGETSVKLTAVDVNGAYTERIYDFVLRSPVEVEAVSADPWAKFATVTGKWFASETPDGIAFQYKKAGESNWIDLAVVTPNASARTYSAEIRGLEPETEYVFRAVSTKDKETKEVSFTTESAEVLHNMSFDNWYQDGKAWMPNLDSSYLIWDSANPGSAKFGYIPTTPTDDVAVAGTGKQAVRMETLYALVKLAAGNIYTGKFGGTVGTKGAYLDWGVPFSSRPLALTGYYKYQPVAIDNAQAPYADMKGQTDICQIQILLTDWDAPFTINTTTDSFVDFDNDEHIIAFGKLETSESSDTYQKFQIKLDYRDMTRTPKYIVITACSSKFGDYFTGGVGSTLYVDEFDFVYDPDDLQ